MLPEHQFLRLTRIADEIFFLFLAYELQTSLSVTTSVRSHFSVNINNQAFITFLYGAVQGLVLAEYVVRLGY